LDIQQNNTILRIILILFFVRLTARDLAALFIFESDRLW